MNTTSTAYLIVVTNQLNTAVSVAAPRLAKGSNMHPIAAYAAQYDADRAELALEMSLNPYTRTVAR